MFILLAYLFTGLLCARFVRGRVRIDRNKVESKDGHGNMCDTTLSRRACDNYRGECWWYDNPQRERNIAFILTTPLVWPVYLIAWFMLAEKLPRLPKRETQEEKFQRMLANDPMFASIYNDLNNQFKVGQ